MRSVDAHVHASEHGQTTPQPRASPAPKPSSRHKRNTKKETQNTKACEVPSGQRLVGHKAQQAPKPSCQREKKRLERLPHQPFALAVDVDAAAVLHPPMELPVVHLLQDGPGADRQPSPAVDLVLEKLAVVHVAVDVPAVLVEKAPWVTQDNTLPAPVFKAQALHSKKSASPEKGAVGKISLTVSKERVVWYWNHTWCGVTEL